MLTGAVLARAGFNRRAAYATAAMVIAAELPDIDTVAGFFGPVTGLEHHRGITHTFLAVPFEAALVTAAFYVFHRLRKSPPTKAPVRWLWLYAGALVALLSHLLLDWTNNYGVRPFFPFNPRWYAGSFVFIFEPVLFLILLLALVGPALFGLINAEVGARKPLFRGRPSALLALVAVAALYVFRFDEHAKALRLAALSQAAAIPPDPLADASSSRFFASPHPGNPFVWHVVTETPAAYQLSTVNTRTGLTDTAGPSDTLYKPAMSLALLAAKRTYLGRIYLDWSSYPVLSEAPDNSDPNHPRTAVTFADARFLYDASFFHGRPEGGKAPPLSGTVLLDMQAPEGQRVVETRMGSRVQR